MDRQRFDNLLSEVMTDLQNEGFFDRVMAKASGKASKLGALGKNIGTIYQAVSKGQAGVLQNPNAVKAVKTGVKRLQSYETQLSKVFVDFTNDLELMFGENFKNAPANLQQAFQKLNKESTTFIDSLGAVIKSAQDSLTTPPTAPGVPEQEPEAAPASQAPAQDVPDDLEFEDDPEEQPPQQNKIDVSDLGRPSKGKSQRTMENLLRKEITKVLGKK